MGLGLGLDVSSKLMSIRKRVFCDATSQTVGDLTSAPETGTNIMDRWGPIDVPYVECVLICPSDLMAIIVIKIRKNPLPRRVMTTLFTDKTHERSLELDMTAGRLL